MTTLAEAKKAFGIKPTFDLTATFADGTKAFLTVKADNWKAARTIGEMRFPTATGIWNDLIDDPDVKKYKPHHYMWARCEDHNRLYCRDCYESEE